MPLSPGDRLGPYEIVAPIGAGGMGEVYKARDTRLDRIVAIKVLSAALATDREFRERFDREAKSISSLNHPNICTLYDVGHDQGHEFLVLEFLEGETLAARIAKGPLPLPEALKIAVEISSALDKAHRQGIVHRDLKPGNVMLTRAGAKLLDFGLATKNAALAGVPASELPTGVAPLTARGTILGTFQYMAPEQIEGEPADPRTDIFAFGAVLYETITGRKAFTGKSQVSLLGTILKEDPTPVSELQPMTPPALGRVIRTCLRKDRDDRFQSAHDLWLQLQWVEEGGSAAGLPAPVVVHRKRRERSIWIAAGVAFAAVAFGGAWWLKPAPPVTHVVTRFQYTLPEGQNFTRPGRHDVAFSPDGARLAYVANQQLYLRAMDQLEAQPVRGTNEDPMEPVFSPDGQWLAYFTPVGGAGTNAGGSAWVLKKIAVAGGAPVTLGTLAAAPYGATWRNGTIAFGMNAGNVAGVQTVPDSGGAPQTIVTVDPKKERVMHPQLLVDGTHLLFVSAPLVSTTVTEGQIVVQTLDGKDRRTLVNGGTDPRVLPAGQLVYIHDGTLLAVPFDNKRLTVTGGPVPILEGVVETRTTGTGQFAISSEGTLAFRPGTAPAAPPSTLIWVDRQGHEQPISAKPRAYAYPRLSPDGAKIAVGSTDEENDIWVFDLAKETLTRLTFGPAFEIHPAWTLDNKDVLFSSNPSGNLATVPMDILRKAADGTGATEALTHGLEGGYPMGISPDGKSLVFRRPNPSFGLYVLPLEPKGDAHALIADPNFSVLNGEISPDGRWIAYDSTESGRPEVYVRPFPAVDSGRWQISAEGGSMPLWARSGREIFFLNAANRMIAVSVPAGPSFTYGKPEALFDFTPYFNAVSTGRMFDISPDGKRFLTAKPVGSGPAAARPSIVVVSHWFDEVKARMPAQR